MIDVASQVQTVTDRFAQQLANVATATAGVRHVCTEPRRLQAAAQLSDDRRAMLEMGAQIEVT